VTELETIGMMPDDEEDDVAPTQATPSAAVVDRRFSIFHSSSDIRPGHWQACIFKVGDDVRQVMVGCILFIIFFQ